MNDEMKPEGGDAPDTSNPPVPKIPMRIQLQWLAIIVTGLVPGMFIVAYAPNTFIEMIGFTIALLPFIWVIRQGILLTRHLTPYYVSDTSRDRFCFNVPSVKRAAVALFPLATYQGVRDGNMVDPFGAAFLLMVLSGFIGHFVDKRYARRQARKKNREN